MAKTIAREYGISMRRQLGTLAKTGFCRRKRFR